MAHEEKQEEQKSSGWGWGGWLSSAVSKVSSSVNTYVTPTVTSVASTVKATASSIVNDLMADEEAEEDAEKTTTKPSTTETSTAQSDTSLSESQTQSTAPPSEANVESASGATLPSSADSPVPSSPSEEPTGSHAAFFAVSLFDKGVHFLDKATDLVGSVVKESLSTAKEMAADAYDASRHVIDKGREVGASFTHQSLDALESVGKKAMQLLTEDVGTPEKPRLRPVFPIPPVPAVISANGVAMGSSGGVAERGPKALTFDGLFEEFHGASNLQALENLATECTVKWMQFQAANVAMATDLETHSQAIRELLDTEGDIPTIDTHAVLASRLVAEVHSPRAAELLTKIGNTMVDAAPAAFDELVSLFLQTIEDDTKLALHLQRLRAGRPATSANGGVHPRDVLDVANTSLKEIGHLGVKRLAETAAAAVEVILRLCEGLLVGGNVDMATPEDRARRAAELVQAVAAQLAADLSTLSTAFVTAANAIGSAGKDKIAEQHRQHSGGAAVATASSPSDESAAVAKQLEAAVTAMITNVVLDAQHAAAHVRDAKQHAATVCCAVMIPSPEQRGEHAVTATAAASTLTTATATTVARVEVASTEEPADVQVTQRS